MKKTPVSRLPKTRPGSRSTIHHWHNGGDIEIHQYARSLHKAAKALVENINLEPNPRTAWDACPAILLYRQAIELHLKSLVGEGCTFLPSPTDHITLYKTHSLRWLAQIVCQIIKAVGWEKEFKCEGISSIVEFRAVVNELEALEPVSCTVHSGGRDGSVPGQLQPPSVVRFAKRLDALLNLLDVTADAAAAVAAGTEFDGHDDPEPTIH